MPHFTELFRGSSETKRYIVLPGQELRKTWIVRRL